MKFVEAFFICRAELLTVLQHLFPLSEQFRRSWSTPDVVTELSLGLDEWPFLGFECGEPLKHFQPSRFSLGPFAESLGIEAQLRLSTPDLVDVFSDDDDDNASISWTVSNDRESVRRHFTRMLHALLLADLSTRRESIPISFHEQIRFYIYNDIDDARFSLHPLFVDKRRRETFERGLKNVIDESLRAFFIELLDADASEDDDISSLVLSVVRHHPAAQETFGIYV